MRISALTPLALLGVMLVACTSAVASARQSLIHDSTVEYVEVGGLVAASENVRVELGPGRSYWFNGTDGSRWAADVATVPGKTPIVIISQGMGIINPEGRTYIVRHVEGPREVERGWYGRVVEVTPAQADATRIMTEDGREFVVRGTEPRDTRTPFTVVVSEDASKIFMLDGGETLEVVRGAPG